jgi:hypothetical protein
MYLKGSGNYDIILECKERFDTTAYNGIIERENKDETI